MNCDGLARWYRWLEYLGMGRRLEHCRFTFLPEVTDARRVLMLGDGDGRFLAAFLRANPSAEVDSVDSSAWMLALAKRRAADHAGRVRFYHADACRWTPPRADYDLVVTHFFLDCFTDEQLVPLAVRLASVTAGNARWIVSEFHQPARGWAAWRSRLWIGGLYAFFRVATGLRVRRLPDYHAALQVHGFGLVRDQISAGGLLVSEIWQRR